MVLSVAWTLHGVSAAIRSCTLNNEIVFAVMSMALLLKNYKKRLMCIEKMDIVTTSNVTMITKRIIQCLLFKLRCTCRDIMKGVL